MLNMERTITLEKVNSTHIREIGITLHILKGGIYCKRFNTYKTDGEVMIMENQFWPSGSEGVKDLPKAVICPSIYLPFLEVNNDLPFSFDSKSHARSSHLMYVNWNSISRASWAGLEVKSYWGAAVGTGWPFAWDFLGFSSESPMSWEPPPAEAQTT